MYSLLKAFRFGILIVLGGLSGLIAHADSGNAQTQAPLSARPIKYYSAEYDFHFELPASWKGYTLHKDKWTSWDYNEHLDKEVVVGHGPIIILRHPAWTKEKPRQDIPILVFTRREWKLRIDEGAFAGGFAEEISHNSQYVFAIHNRFNWSDDIVGWEEARKIVDRNMTKRPLRKE